MNNYEDILPDNWLTEAVKANQAYLSRLNRVHPLIRIRGRQCFDSENLCHAKRLGGCILNHCILRYPTEAQFIQFK